MDCSYINKKRVLLLPLLLIMVTFLLWGCGEAKEDLKPTNRFFVNDFADVISSADEDEMYNRGVKLQEKTGAQVVVVTVKSLNGSDIRDFGLALGRDWGIGQKDKNNGVLLLLSLDEREISIEVGYGLEGGLTDIETKIIQREYAIPHLKQDDFSTGLKKAYIALVNEVYIEYGIQPEDGYTPAEQIALENNEDEYDENNPLQLIAPFVLVIIFIILFFSRGRRGNIPFIFFGGGRGGGGFGGGGFGGGGGFSGGGGSFGGGGSSSKF
ncbi:MAG: TPM domain-containing protein [Oscillospiraceae bacterium]|nr:TPM domain-containing protein [Oscillospiraceae bacterium]MDD4414589.1 TPM domain-containing protein [Oscillospiraceae bacterium]